MDPLTIAAIGKGAGAVFGAIQSARGKMKQNQADQMGPGLVDPNRARDLERARRRQAQLESGTDTTTQQALKEGRQSTRATQRDLAKSTGGNVGGTVSALLQSQRLGGNIANNAFAGAAQRGMAMSNMANTIAQQISQRKLDIQQYRSVQRRAEGARLAKEGFANLTGGLVSGLLSGGGSGNQGLPIAQTQAPSVSSPVTTALGAGQNLQGQLGGSPADRLRAEGNLDFGAINNAQMGGVDA